MAIDYQTTLEGNILVVKSTGYDDSLDEVERYGLAVISACIESGCTRALCDETELEYRIGTFDIYQAATFLSEHTPRMARIAIVCNERYFDDTQFWETVAVNRGLTARVFKDVASARSWLQQ
jgi:hypothetical protein